MSASIPFNHLIATMPHLTRDATTIAHSNHRRWLDRSVSAGRSSRFSDFRLKQDTCNPLRDDSVVPIAVWDLRASGRHGNVLAAGF